MASRSLTLLIVAIAAIGLVALVLRLGPAAGSCIGVSIGHCAPKSTPGPGAIAVPGATTTIPPFPLETPTTSEVAATPPSAGLTFDEEFDGSSLRPDWQTTWGNFGSTVWSPDHATVRDGVLTISAQRSGNAWVSDEIDTVGHFAQRYGTFSARVLVPQGSALWVTFWLAEGWQVSQTEIDVMEVCANPPGQGDGNDATVLHNIIHFADGSSAHHAGTVPNLTGSWHDFGVDWRRDHLIFTVDGVPISQETNPDKIPSVALSPVFDLAVGGWCGIPSDATPSNADLKVDWLRIGP